MTVALGCHLSEHIAHVRRPVTHTDAYWEREALRLQAGSDALSLLHGQRIEGRKAPQMSVVGHHLGQTRLYPWALTDDGPHKARGLTTRTGRETPTAPRGRASKAYKEDTVKMG